MVEKNYFETHTKYKQMSLQYTVLKDLKNNLDMLCEVVNQTGSSEMPVQYKT